MHITEIKIVKYIMLCVFNENMRRKLSSLSERMAYWPWHVWFMLVTVRSSFVRSLLVALMLVFSVLTELSSVVSFCSVALLSCCIAVMELWIVLKSCLAARLLFCVLVIIFFNSFISLLVFILRILSWFNNCLSKVSSCTTSHLTWQALLAALPLPAYIEPVRTDRQKRYIHSPDILTFLLSWL